MAAWSERALPRLTNTATKYDEADTLLAEKTIKKREYIGGTIQKWLEQNYIALTRNVLLEILAASFP